MDNFERCVPLLKRGVGVVATLLWGCLGATTGCDGQIDWAARGGGNGTAGSGAMPATTSGSGVGGSGGASNSGSGAGGTSTSGNGGAGDTGSSVSSGAGGGSPMLCGNGVVDPGEVCDDGNNDDGDGCDATCSTLECIVPLTHASVQAGIDDVSCAIVWVQPGSYQENLSIERSVTLAGSGPSPSELNGLQQGRTVTIGSGYQVALHDLVVTGGLASAGAGIETASDLTLLRVIVQGNHAIAQGAFGGGIAVDSATLTLDDSHVQSNLSTCSGPADPMLLNRAFGGGIGCVYGQIDLLNGSSLSSNVATANSITEVQTQGGGLYGWECTVTLQGSSITNNLASITSNPNATAGTQESLASRGGGVYLNRSDLTLSLLSSISNNTAETIVTSMPSTQSHYSAYGGGLYLTGLSTGSTVTALTGSIINSNQALATCPDSCGAAGGGIYGSHTDITLNYAALSNNSASATSQGLGSNPSVYASFGGAFTQAGTGSDTHHITLIDSVVAGNSAGATMAGSSPFPSASAEGGGLGIGAGTGDAVATLLALGSTIANNTASSNGRATGGGVYASAGTGEAHSYVLITNSTISGNTATGPLWGRGGGITAETGTGDAQTTVALHSATITNNHASTEGGGLALLTGISQSQVQATIENSILALNTAAADADCHADASHFDSASYSFLGVGTACTIVAPGPGLLLSSDPLLGPLQLNGSSTPTHALSSQSIAINAGDPAGCKDHDGLPLSTDQRGMTRISGSACDLGAYELIP